MIVSPIIVSPNVSRPQTELINSALGPTPFESIGVRASRVMRDVPGDLVKALFVFHVDRCLALVEWNSALFLIGPLRQQDWSTAAFASHLV